MLPIRKIVLYKHGVGYFERQGEVEGDESIDLFFRKSEMNDVLKSLTVLDLSGGLISSISYESTKPIEKQLEDIAITMPEKNSLTGFLSQIKGAQAQIELAGETIEGQVMGIETITRKVNDETVWSNFLCLLVDGSSLRYFDVLDIRNLTFSDPSLKKDLKHLLDILIGSKKKDLKRLTIFARGKDKRQVMASYVVETPVWKTSYRILLTSESEEKPMIQGWALVDNTQDEDWDDVALTLVAGLPISFVHDLYSPRYKKRPVVEVREEAAYAPPVLEESLDLADDDPAPQPLARRLMAAQPMAAPAPAAPGGGGPMPPPAPKMAKAMARPAARQQSTPVQTRTVEVGDLFQYEITNEVTVKRNQSALVPILQAPFSGKRVAIYNGDVRANNPMSAVLFKNSTGMTLEGGALTVLEDETYMGESMLETIKPDEERVIPFSVELGCVISIDHESSLESVHMARIVHGSLRLYRYRINQTIYVIKNKQDRKIDLFLEHRFLKKWKLVNTPDPAEKTENFYRFRFDVSGNNTTRFIVSEKGDETEIHHISQVTRDQLSLWIKRKYIDEKTQQIIESLVGINEKSHELNRKINNLDDEEKRIFQNQKRLRENLKALGTSPDERGLRERYISGLSQEEDRIKAINTEVRKLKDEKESLDRKAQSIIESLRFEQAL